MAYRQVRGRAASLSPKSRPKVHLPAQSAPRLRRNPPTAARTAGKTHRCLNGGHVPESVKAGAAIGFLIAASVFSHRLPSLRTHAPCRRFSGSTDWSRAPSYQPVATRPHLPKYPPTTCRAAPAAGAQAPGSELAGVPAGAPQAPWLTQTPTARLSVGLRTPRKVRGAASTDLDPSGARPSR